MSYPINKPLTYTAVATTADHPLDTFSYSWTFSDGGSGSGNTLSHTWTTVDNHTADVLATDNQFLTSGSATKTISADSYVWEELGLSTYYINAPISGNLNNTTIISVGGVTTGSVYHGDTYLYDGVTWSQVGSLTYPRSSINANRAISVIKLPNGNILVCGNTGSPAGVSETTTEIYDPIAQTWSVVGAMANGRAWFCYPILLNDGRVMVWGGEDHNGSINNVYEFFDYNTNTWSETGMPTHLTTGDTAICVPFMMKSGKIAFYLPASAKVAIYNPDDDTWTDSPQYLNIVAFANYSNMAEAGDGNLYIFGPIISDQTSVLCYNVGSNTWSLMPNAPGSVTATTVRPISDGTYVMVFPFTMLSPLHYCSILFNVFTGTWEGDYFDYVDFHMAQGQGYNYGYGILNNRIIQFGSPNPITPPYTQAEVFMGI